MIHGMPSGLSANLRESIEHSRLPGLQAATASYNRGSEHVRVDFFFAPLSSGIDFNEIEYGILGKAGSTRWPGVRTIGFAAFFDWPSTTQALLDPARLYPG